MIWLAYSRIDLTSSRSQKARAPRSPLAAASETAIVSVSFFSHDVFSVSSPRSARTSSVPSTKIKDSVERFWSSDFHRGCLDDDALRSHIAKAAPAAFAPAPHCRLCRRPPLRLTRLSNHRPAPITADGAAIASELDGHLFSIAVPSSRRPVRDRPDPLPGVHGRAASRKRPSVDCQRGVSRGALAKTRYSELPGRCP